ncbi:TPA: hypothetical protein ACPIAT_001042 [Pseudomonas aeruginosa]
MSNELTDVRCPCGAEFQADSYDAGFIAGSGMCQNCDAALPPKDICTCPSGNGSLRHPCPAHPAVEQAGGDERDFQAEGAQEVPSPVSQEYDRHLISLLRKGEALPGHQEEAADEIERLRDWNDHLNNTVLPNILNPTFLMLMKGGERLLDLCTKDGEFIGVSLNDMKDVFDWMVTHARIAPDQAALAQPSPKCATCNDSGQIVVSGPHYQGEFQPPEYETEPCDMCAQPSPAQAEQAEAERPEVVARVVHSNPVVLGQCGPLNANDELMTVAQHAASVARWAEMFNRVEQQRDAAMARVAELEAHCVRLGQGGAERYWENRWRDADARLQELEKQEPVATVAKVPGEDWNSLDFHRDLQDMQPGTKLYTAPVAQAQHSVPELLVRAEDFVSGKEVPQAWLDVQAERRRQVEAEGWTPEHDDLYCAAELPRAAAAYILNGANDEAPAIWPFSAKWWKPSTARRDMVKACALALAEIERLDRAAHGKEGNDD